jgi:hypothetical protein
MALPTIITRTVTISPGESFTLPTGATVVSITDVLENTCNLDLPEPEPLVEYFFKFAINEDDNDAHPVGGGVNIESIMIDGVSTNLSFTQFDTDNTGNSGGVNVWNGEITTNNNLLSSYPVKFVTIAFDNGGANYDVAIVVIKMPQSYLNKVFLKVSNLKFENGFYVTGGL